MESTIPSFWKSHAQLVMPPGSLVKLLSVKETDNEAGPLVTVAAALALGAVIARIARIVR